MTTISEAVAVGQGGDADEARRQLLDLWAAIGADGDPLHRCTLAHYLADLYSDPAQALAWDIRALDAADAITDQRVRRHHADLHIAGFYPSLHLNLADNYRRLGSFEAAGQHLVAARAHSSALQHDSYGDLIRNAIDDVSDAVAQRDTAARPSAPGATA